MSEWDAFPVAGDNPLRLTVTPKGSIPPAGRALLDTIAGSESPDYNTVYGGGKFDDLSDHPRRAVPIKSGPNAGKTSSAAGRYQFLGSTWDEVKKEAGLPDFSENSQDLGAWHLAQKTYKAKTGRDLESALAEVQGNPNALQAIGKALSGTWTSLPGGIEPNSMTSSFAARHEGGSPRAVSWDAFPPANSAPQASPQAPEMADTGGRFTDNPGQSFRTAREGESPAVATGGQAFGSGVLKGLSFNFIDEIAGTLAAGGYNSKDPVSLNNATALVRGLYKRATGDSDAEAAYKVTSSAVRDALERQREQQPVASIGGELTGALVTAPLTGGSGVVRGAGVGAKALAGAKTGAAYGAISGAGEGTDAESRATGAVSGGLLGAAVGAPLGAVLPAGKAAKSAVPSADELKAAATAGFRSPEVAELTIAPVAVRELSDGLKTSLNTSGIDDVLVPRVFALLGKMTDGPADAVVTGQNLQTMRRTFQGLAGSADKTERLAAKKVIDAIDEFIPNIAAKDILSGDPKAAAQAWATARGNYAAAMRSDEIAKALIKAQRQAEAAGSGANIDNATRQQFKAILNSESRSRGFNAEEIAAMESAVRGTTWGNFARLLGKAAPTGIVSGGLSSGAGFAAGGPAGAVILPIAGWIAKKAGDRSTAKQVAQLDELVRSRAPLAKSMEDTGAKAAALQTERSPRTISAAVLSARNLSNNLKDAGINLSPAEIMRAIQGPVRSAAEDDQPNR